MPLLNIPDELLELRASLRQFIDREVRPIEERTAGDPGDAGRSPAIREEVLKLRKRSAELGFYAMHMPEEVGGGRALVPRPGAAARGGARARA